MNILRFSLLLAASALSRPAAAEPADVTPTDRVYQLSVVTADGTEFDDCATFRENHDLVLLAGGGLAIDWITEASDPSGRKFHAVTDGRVPSSNPIGLAVHGSFVGSDGIQGNAVNDLGLTFTFNGQLKRACLDNATYYPDQNPYAAAPAIPVQFEPGRGSLAGQGYVVELYGSATPQECLYFGIDGTLSRGNGANQNWGMDRLNSKRGTFQAVGSIVQGTAGRALRGERSSLGELRVHGIESDAAGLREIVGSGRRTDNCVN
jgi:hypothetical protein